MAKATLGGGCFWCIEAALKDIDGVREVVSGYAGGDVEDPSYDQVCSGRTGHAEVVQVDFDEEALPYRDLLEIFFSVHDPTTKDRQGADVGSQYRSVILAHDPVQQEAAQETIAEVQQEFDRPIVTQVESLQTFWPAEPEHQDYYARNPQQGYCRAVIESKVAKMRQRWAHRLKT